MRIILISLILAMFSTSYGQIYVLRDHRDTVVRYETYDSLPLLCDSFFSKMKLEDAEIIKYFTPTLEYMKKTADTSQKLKENDFKIKQKAIQLKVERAYKKALKQAKKDNLKFKHYSLLKKEYQKGTTESGNEFCYVTLTARKKKNTMTIKFLATKIEDVWFIVDELYINWD